MQPWADAGDGQVPAPAPERRLPVGEASTRPVLDDGVLAAAGWWWLGAHGGAGVSTLQVLIPGGVDACRRWPVFAWGGPPVVVLVCRTHLAGVCSARDAVRQWAAGEAAEGLRLAGVVAVADSPGQLARPQREALRLVSGVVPRLWRVPWLEVLRAVATPDGVGRPPALAQLDADLEGLRPAPAVASGGTP